MRCLPENLANHLCTADLIIPYYHTISDAKLPHIRHLYAYKNERQFINDIEFLGRRFYPLSLSDLMDHVRNVSPLKRPSFILTFDDGFSQMYSFVAPLLRKKGLPAIFFVNTDVIDNKALNHKNKASLLLDHLQENPNAIERLPQSRGRTGGSVLNEMKSKILSLSQEDEGILEEIAESLGVSFGDYLERVKPYLTSTQIRDMIAQGFSFGAHSLNHPLYSTLALTDQVRQTVESVRVLRDAFDLSYTLFAFPHSDAAVKDDFFHLVKPYVDLTFGTGGLIRDPISSNLGRINFERDGLPAGYVLIRECVRKRFRELLRTDLIERR